MAATVTLDGPVGLRHRTTKVASLDSDQRKIIGLLAGIAPNDGGQQGKWAPPPASGGDGHCPRVLANAIWDFQTHRKMAVIDGVVDPGGNTLARMNTLAAPSSPANIPIGPNGISPALIRVSADTTAHSASPIVVSNMVILPVSFGSKLQEIRLKTSIRQFRYKVQKDGKIFWVGVAVPLGTVDFSRVQVFFHPTVVQSGKVLAKPEDYPTFAGAWRGSIERYVPMQGGQIAGARLMPLLVPFMTMSAAPSKGNPNPSDNMFSTRPVETLNAITAAIQRDMGVTTPPQALARLGVSSFSSGITYLRAFIKTVGGSGLIKEVHDFDGVFIIGVAKAPTTCPGAAAKVVTQVAISHPPPGWIALTPDRWTSVTAFRKQGTHAQVGWMTYYSAMIGSVIL